MQGVIIKVSENGRFGFIRSNELQENCTRIPEVLLHWLEFLGGSPAAFIAQRIVHHKLRKSSFMATYWSIVAVQTLGLIAWKVVL